MRVEILSAITILGLAGAARAQTADEILKMQDDAYSNFNDLTVDAKMFVKEPGGTAAREYAFTTWQKGRDKRLVRFNAPGDVKGMAMLVEGRDTMYVFLPAFSRVRRLGTHAKNQSFMGSDFGYEDMAETTYGGIYAPKLVATEADAWVLDLTLLPGKDAEFPKLKMWVDKASKLATKIEYFDAAGKKARTQTRTQFKKDQGNGDHLTPEWVSITDHRRNDHETRMQLFNSKVNTGLSDDLFTQRSLVRGP